MSRFNDKMNELINKLMCGEHKVIYVKFRYSMYAIMKTNKDRLKICYYTPTTSYIKDYNTTVIRLATFNREASNLTPRGVIKWFNKNWTFALPKAKIYIK